MTTTIGLRKKALSEYKSVWLFALFDLPVDTKEARKEYTRFRKFLLNQGFGMLQFSVYARYCDGEDKATTFRHRIKKSLPPEGEVRLIAITDRQFGKMEVFWGGSRQSTEKKPSQLMLF
jgi:CRISPR-associated protein Cas2